MNRKEIITADLLARVQWGVKVQYKGIINVEELSAHNKKKPKYPDPLDSEWIEWLDKIPEEKYGLKTGLVKKIIVRKKGSPLFYIGKYPNYSKLVLNAKPILFSSLTEPITVAGENFVPKDRLREIYPGEQIGLNPATWSHRSIDLLNQWHCNYRLLPGEFIPATNEYA